MKKITSLIIAILYLSGCGNIKETTDSVEEKSSECSTIFLAVLNCEIEDIKRFIEEDPSTVNEQDLANHQITPIFYAAQINDVEKFDFLIEYGADIKAMTNDRVFPQYDVLYTALKYDSDKVLERIIELDIFDLNKKYNNCANAIYVSVRSDSPKTLEILLNNGVDTDVTTCPNAGELSPLGWAALANSVNAAKVLIDFGEDVNEQKTERDHTILGRACSARDGSLEMVKLLVEYGADIEKANDANFTPLMKAVATSKIEVVEYLISLGANVNARTNYGKYSPLHYACSRNNLQIVELLLKNGANPNVYDMNNLKPIERLANEDDKENMIELINEYSPNF